MNAVIVAYFVGILWQWWLVLHCSVCIYPVRRAAPWRPHASIYSGLFIVPSLVAFSLLILWSLLCLLVFCWCIFYSEPLQLINITITWYVTIKFNYTKFLYFLKDMWQSLYFLIKFKLNSHTFCKMVQINFQFHKGCQEYLNWKCELTLTHWCFLWF